MIVFGLRIPVMLNVTGSEDRCQMVFQRISHARPAPLMDRQRKTDERLDIGPVFACKALFQTGCYDAPFETAEHRCLMIQPADGTAEAGSDYNPATGTLHFVPGTTSRFIEVETLKDDIDESNETLTVTLSNPIPSESTWLGDAVGVGTVIGDVERRIRLANRAYLPEMGRAAAFNAVKCRIDRALSRTAPGSLKQALDRLAPPAPPSLGLRRPHVRTVSIERLLGSLAFALQSNGPASTSCG